VKYGVSDEAQEKQKSRRAQSPKVMAAWRSLDGEWDRPGKM
jgi:hypothetical protein